MKTHVIIIVDDCSSEVTSSDKNDIIGGFNIFLENQRKIETDEARITLIRYVKHMVHVIYNCEPLSTISALTETNPKKGPSFFKVPFMLYLNAFVTGIKIGEEENPNFDRTICVLMTDGSDNLTNTVTPFANMIQASVARGNWTFLYIGQNAGHWANQTGMPKNNVVVFDPEVEGQTSSFAEANYALTNIRSNSELLQSFNAFHPRE